MAQRQIKLGAFIPTTSQHAAGWRHPASRPQDHLSLDYAIELAKTPERGLFDAYFLADGLAVNWSHGASKHNKNVGYSYDKETGHFFEAAKQHEPLHQGKYFNVQGALNVSRPPQGYPVIVQAGQSEDGRELAAKYAEVIVTAQQSLTDAQAFYRDVKGRLAKYGRHAVT